MSGSVAQGAPVVEGGTAELSETQLEICRDFIGACFDRLRGNLEMLLGHPLTISLQDVTVEEDTSIRVRMPVTGAACGMQPTPGGGTSLLMMEPPLAHTLLGLCRMVSDEELAKAREEGAALTPEDRTDMEEVDNFLAAAFSDEAKARTEGRIGFEPTGVLSIENSTWANGEDPLEAVPYVTLMGLMTIGNTAVDEPFHLFIPQESMGAILPAFASDDGSCAGLVATSPTAAGRPRSMSPGPVRARAAVSPGAAPAAPVVSMEDAALLCLAPPEVQESLGAALPGRKTFVRGAADLLEALDGGLTPDVLVARVDASQPHMLRLLSALRQHPSLLGRSILVLHDQPTPHQVVRCGQLGLLHVLPAGAQAPLLQQKLADLLSGAPQ